MTTRDDIWRESCDETVGTRMDDLCLDSATPLVVATCLSLLLLLSCTVDKPGYEFSQSTLVVMLDSQPHRDNKNKSSSAKVAKLLLYLVYAYFVPSSLDVYGVLQGISHQRPRNFASRVFPRPMQICMPLQSNITDDIRHDCLLPGQGTSSPVHRDMRSQVPQRAETLYLAPEPRISP